MCATDVDPFGPDATADGPMSADATTHTTAHGRATVDTHPLAGTRRQLTADTDDGTVLIDYDDLDGTTRLRPTRDRPSDRHGHAAAVEALSQHTGRPVDVTHASPQLRRLLSERCPDAVTAGSDAGPPSDTDLSGYVPVPGQSLRPDDPRITTTDRQVPVDDVRRQVDEVPGPWVHVTPTVFQSGHKLHITGSTAAQSKDLVGRLAPVCDRYGMSMKVASAALCDQGGPPMGKVATVYLPRRATLDADTGAVARALVGYRGTGETVPNDSRVVGDLHHRFEFTADPGRDIDRYDAADRRLANDLYRPAAG